MVQRRSLSHWQLDRFHALVRQPRAAITPFPGSIIEEGSGYEDSILAGGRGCARAGKPGVRRRQHQDRFRFDLQRPDRRDRQRHAQLLRARARPHRAQDGRQAGRGDLRGRRAEARCRQAEDREAGAVRQGRFHRRLHLVQRAAGILEDRGGLADLPDLGQCRPVADRGRSLFALRVLDLLAERPDTRRHGSLHEPEGRQERLFDRTELRRRQGHARGREEHLQGRDQGRGIYGLAEPARLLRRTLQGARLRRGVDLRVLSRRRRRAVPQSICAGRPEEHDAALYCVHRRRAVAAAPEGERVRGSRRAGMGQRPPQRAEQALRRRLPQEVHRPASDLLRRASL